ncbi:MAG: M15 family metallopeptidase [Firmicutes bacterium]|nr:M15 family metallopeptidase [Bacillota bacterium]
MSLSQSQLKKIFGAFSYRENPRRRGAIIIDPEWVRRNIVSIDTPFGRFPCHRLVSSQMKAFIDRAAAENLINDIGGIWVPRHVLWNPAKPLSGHAFGCDIDINVDDGLDGPGGKINYGANSFQPTPLIGLATEHGFEWGGAWRSAKDGMHFSCIRLIGDAIPSNRSNSDVLPLLKRGSRGESVKDLQRRLNEKGYRLVVDGIFGPKTAAALANWQKRCNLRRSAQTDPQTWASLVRG